MSIKTALLATALLTANLAVAQIPQDTLQTQQLLGDWKSLANTAST